MYIRVCYMCGELIKRGKGRCESVEGDTHIPCNEEDDKKLRGQKFIDVLHNLGIALKRYPSHLEVREFIKKYPNQYCVKELLEYVLEREPNEDEIAWALSGVVLDEQIE